MKGIISRFFNNHENFDTDHLNNSLRKRALRGGSATIFAQILKYSIQMIGTIFLARILTPNDFGLIAMVTALSLLLENFGVNGFTELIIQEKTINQEQMSTLFWINCGICISLTLIFMILSPIIAGFYHEPQLKSISTVIALSITLTSFSTFHMAILKRNMQFYRTSLNEVLATLFSTIAAIILADIGWGYWALVTRYILLSVALTIGAWILCHWRPGLPYLNSSVKLMIKFSLITYVNFCFNYFRKNFDKIFVGKFLGTQSLGYYDRAYQFSGMFPNQLTIPLTSVAVATLSKLRTDPPRYLRYFTTVLSMLAFISMPLSAGLTLVGNDLIVLILGSPWHNTGRIFSAFAPGLGLTILYGTHGWLHISLGRPDKWFCWSITAFAASVLFLVVGLFYGAIGVALAQSILYSILLVPALWYAGRPLKLRFTFFISIIWKYILSAAISGLLCWLIFYQINSTAIIYTSLNIFVRIFVSLLLCLIIYMALIILFYKSFVTIKQFIIILKDIILSNKFDKTIK